MNESTSGPRKWAFVVIAGGTLFSLPFVQNVEPENDSQPQVHLDVVAPIPDKPTMAKLPSAGEIVKAQDVIPSLMDHVPRTIQQPVSDAHRHHDTLRVNAETISAESVRAPAHVSDDPTSLPDWASTTLSPLDELIQHSPDLPEYAPAVALPMQPLRPWISGPNDDSAVQKSQVNLNSSVFPASERSAMSGSGKAASTASLSPWRDEHLEESAAATPTASVSHTASALPPSSVSHSAPIDRWPDELLSPEQRARFSQPKVRPLASAIVPPELVTDAAAGQQLQAGAPPLVGRPVLSRNPNLAPLAAQVRFGQSQSLYATHSIPISQSSSSPVLPPTAQTTLPVLPETRRNHVIYQPHPGVTRPHGDEQPFGAEPPFRPDRQSRIGAAR